MAEYTEYHPLKFWLDPASIAEIVAHIQSYLVANPINSNTEIETIIHDYLIAHPELIGGVDSVNGQTGEVVLSADNISAGESVTIADVLDSLQNQIDDIVASIPSDYQQLIDDVSDLKSAISTVSDGYNPYKLIRNAYITGGGAEVYYAGWDCSDYIPIPAEGLEIYATVKSTYNAFYDENKAFLTGGTFTVQVGLNRILPITNAKYIRLSNTAAGMSATKIYGQTALNTEEIENIESYLSVFPSVLEGNVMPDTTEWITGRVYNGVYDSSITSIKCTDYIPVIGGEKYYIYGGYISAEYFGVYDKDKNLISGWSFTSVSTDNSNASTAVITLAQAAKYIRLNALVSAMSSFPTDAYIGLYPNYLPKKADMSDYVPRIKGNGTLSDKKILVIGDSISTDVYGSYKKWVTDLCEQGFFSKGYVTNNSYHATGYVTTYKEGGVVVQDTFLNRITALGDLSGYDMIVTFGGINDWIQSVDFEEFKDAVDDYYAYLIEHATQARIVVIAPLRTSLYGTTNSEEKTQKDYSDYIKSVALDYSFPVLNLTDEGGFCPEKSTAFSNMWTLLPTGQSSHDGVHPNADWEKKYLAPQIAWFLSNLI